MGLSQRGHLIIFPNSVSPFILSLTHMFYSAYRYYLTEKFNYVLIIKFYFILFIRILFWLRTRTCEAYTFYTPGVKNKVVSLKWKSTIPLLGIISCINIWWYFFILFEAVLFWLQLIFIFHFRIFYFAQCNFA